MRRHFIIFDIRLLTGYAGLCIWVDRVGRDTIIGYVGNSGKFVSFRKVYRSCVVEGTRRLKIAEPCTSAVAERE